MKHFRAALSKSFPAAQIPSALAIIFLQACAGDPKTVPITVETLNPGQEQALISRMATAARVSFHYADFYSLTAPERQSSCAGDAKTYFYPFATTENSSSYSPKSFPKDIYDENRTIHPDFIANISVDLTDANTNSSQNIALSCSYQSNPGSPPSSNCATFDYGAIGGVSSNMGGSLFLVGGIQGSSVSDTAATRAHSVSCGTLLKADSSLGYNSCARSTLALAIDTLPASAATDPPNPLVPGLTSATEAISTWGNFGGGYSYSGPEGLAGAAAAYSPGAQNLIIVGGSSVLNAGASGALGRITADTWSLDLRTQLWSLTNNLAIASSLLTMKDIFVDPDTSEESTYYLPKSPLGKALFGYSAAQGMAVNAMTTNGNPAGVIDVTDRVMIQGGAGNAGVTSTLHKFNPTYGPDYVDLVGTGADNDLVQWLDSYHSQLMSNNSMAASKFLPPFNAGDAVLASNFAATSLRNNVTGAGYVLSAGGFDIATTSNSTPVDGGALMISKRTGGVENISGNFGGVPDNLAGIAQAPVNWANIAEGGGLTVPFYGGSTLLPGFALSTNDIVYFGGADCKDYLTNSSAPCTSFANPGLSLSLTSTPVLGSLAGAVAKPFGGEVPPKAAGMAAARGLDGDGNVIMVAWGGMKDKASPALAATIYYLYNNVGVPTWVKQDLTGTLPRAVGNGALVFSHVTRKFYLFGGYSPTTAFLSGDTWELTVSGACTAAVGSCTFSWRQLNSSSEFSCSPACPSARQGHRMVEANYYNRNPGGTTGLPAGGYGANGESTCGITMPCSFGIFMEGGMTAGNQPSYFTDRWMFDPTANAGAGQWQKMTEFPARTLAAMTGLDYTTLTGATVRRAVLFGGEMGLLDPNTAATGQYFVAPTLGDTLMYDFKTSTWNRVTLLGKGYKTSAGGVAQEKAYAAAQTLWGSSNEFERRQAFSANAPEAGVSELSPPPLAGGIMVTRTMPRPTHDATSTVTPLMLPEVFLFGGRLKDGRFHTLNSVYKFCAGSTGEIPLEDTPLVSPVIADTGLCDFFDETNNPDSPNPTSGYVGRWLKKSPTATFDTAQVGSYMGAGTYDSTRDLIILNGGRTFKESESNTTPVTYSNLLEATSDFYTYEYQPPTKTWTGVPAETNGEWRRIATCSQCSNPSARYGHTLAFDPLARRLIMVGGYDMTGTPLVQTVQYSGGTYTTPEVWSGKRTVDIGDSSTPCYHWTLIKTFGNLPTDPAVAPPLTGISHAAGIFIPPTGYSTGYYTMLDQSCGGQGPSASTDPSISKLRAGGAYIDIDRSLLGPHENLLLNLSFFPLGTNNTTPESNYVQQSEAAIFKVHLIRTGKTGDEQRTFTQPRHLLFADQDQYPEIAQSISVFAPDIGEPVDEQVVIPLALDPHVDRIRIERYSGSAILMNASVFRLGYR